MSTSPGFEPSEDQRAVAASVARFCAARDVETAARTTEADSPGELWRGLAAMGVFAPTSPGHEDAGGALEICAICETLGEHAFPGPVAATYLAMQVLPEPQRAEVMAGDTLVSLANAGDTLLPYGTIADVFLVAADDTLHSAQPTTAPVAIGTLGGATWGRAELAVGEAVGRHVRGFVIGDIARSAYLAGLAARLVRETSAHAATRKQFGKTLGEFQAVAHPLADCAIDNTAAQTLARAAATAFDSGPTDSALHEAQRLAAGALNTARRGALGAAYTCHQVYGGIGITLEGPAFHLTRRIRQVASEAPGGRRGEDILLADAGLGV
ncbi:MAG: acyl-CoA dehydrogenase [Halioglobus sp.]|nr:acyl-CoA dehydrogenase [Halioglobus sp.]